MAFLGLVAPDIGIDLGTSNVRIYVKGKGIVLSEPTLVIVRDNEKREVLAIGEDARILPGRTPEDILTVRPIRDGVIVDFEMAQVMLQYFITKAIGNHFLVKPHIVVTAPSTISTVERRAISEALKQIGARSIHIVDQPFAAAIGTGLPVYDPIGSLVVDIGGGTTEAAVISLGGLVVAKSLRVAGVKLDEAIAAAFKRDHNMLIGEKTAENLKLDLGGAFASAEDARRAMVRGRDLVTSLPVTIEVTAAQISQAMQEGITQIVGAIKWVLERTPPELSSDIMRNGIYLTGAGAQLVDMDRLIASELGIPVSLAKDPAECSIVGAGYLAENIELVPAMGKGSAPRD
jgi:rod shape-determining protein MreB